MCTLTFLPISEQSFILGANRDESPFRTPAEPPVYKNLHGHSLLYPVDGKAGGSWIVASDQKRITCLLNGAFEPHTYRPPYRKSRGLVVLDSFQWPTTNEFIEQYNFDGIEPFTYVAFEWGAEVSKSVQITEFRWDGEQQHVKTWDGKEPQIWSSASLYSKDVIQKREEWFSQWLRYHSPAKYQVKDVLKFHHFGGEGDEANDLRMNRQNLVRTLSVTSIYVQDSCLEMFYEDLLHDQVYEFGLSLWPQPRVTNR